MPAPKVYILSLDQGGHASRALLFDSRGRLRAAAESLIRTRRIGTDRVEHSAEAVVRSLRIAAEAVTKRLPPRARIRAAALATQRSSIACWDRDSGRPLSPVISWQDRRAARRVAALAGQEREIRRLTGLMLSPHYGASKLAWCLEHLEPVRRAERGGRLAAGPLASFIAARLLTARPCVVDPVNGARTQLLDLQRGDWSPELCTLFGVPDTVLPTCVPNAFPFGELKLGRRAVSLTVVTGDQPAALFAMGAPHPDTAYVNIGTGAFLQCPGTRHIPELLHSIVWRSGTETCYAVEGTVNGAASALQWFAARVGVAPARILKHLPEALSETEEPPAFLNGVGGLGSPYWRPAFRSRFIGRGDTRLRSVAVVESIVFLLHANLERMRGGGVSVRRLVVSGGLARLDGLCQRLADLSELEVLRPELHEATALGAARLTGGITAAPEIPLAHFTPSDNPALARRHARWQDALHAALADS